LGGFTTKNKHLVKSGCALLESAHRVGDLSFLTLTLPPAYAEIHYSVVSEITRQFGQSLARLLRQSSLPGEFVGILEIQSRRFFKHGECALHWHYVFLGRLPGKGWAISADEFRSLWGGLLRRFFDSTDDESAFSASVDVQPVRKSATGYLGKYLSKGNREVSAAIAAGKSDWLPSSWVSISAKLRKAVYKAIHVFSGQSARLLLELLESSPENFVYRGSVFVGRTDSDPGFWVADWGSLSSLGYELVKFFCEFIRSCSQGSSLV
jgi:hypothetical protein